MDESLANEGRGKHKEPALCREFLLPVRQKNGTLGNGFKMWRKLLINSLPPLLVLLSQQATMAESQPLALAEGLNHAELTGRVSFLKDTDGTLTVVQLQAAPYRERFQPLLVNSFGYTNAVYWIKIDVRNPTPAPFDWVLEFDYSVFDSIQLFAADGQLIGTGGDWFPFGQRSIAYRNMAFALRQNGLERGTYFLRLKTTSSMTIPLFAYEERLFHSHVATEQMLFGLYYGGMLVMLVYNLFLLFGTRDRSYLYYILYIATYVLFQATINGLSFQYLWPDQTWWANTCLPIFIFGAVASGLLFSRKFLRSRQTTPRTFLAYYFVLLYCGVGIIASFFLEYVLVIRAAIFICFPAVLLVYFNGFLCLYRGQRSARFFLIAWTTLLLGVLLYAAKALGILPTNAITTWAIQIGSGGEVVLLSLALADRINELSGDLRVRVQELQEARTQVGHSEGRFRSLFDGAEELIFTLDEQFNFHEVNQALSRLLGFQAADIRQKSFFDLLYQDEQGTLGVMLARQKLGELKTTGNSVHFKVAFRQKHVREPKELLVRMQFVDLGGVKELLGRANRPEEELLFRDLIIERLSFTSGNLIGNVEPLADRLTQNLRVFAPPEVVHGVHMGIMEMLINAIEHGNLNVTFEEKTGAIERQDYFEFLESRQKDPRYKDKKVLIEYALSAQRFGLRITDEGQGFDHRKMMAANLDRLNRERVSHGRGILMVLDVFDVVRFNEKGNRVSLIKHLGAAATNPTPRKRREST